MEDENPDLQKKYREIGAPLVYLKKKESELNSAPEIFNFAGSDSGPFSCFIWLRLDIGSSDSENPVVRILWSYPAAPSSVLSDFPNLGKFVFPDRTSLDTSLDLTYTFVLTNGSGIRTYGHGTTFTNGEAVVSLSPYPWCKFFSRLAFLFRVNGEFGRKLVRTLHNCPTPPSGAPFLVPLDLGISFTRPYDRLCSFVDTSPESVLEAFEVDDLLRILADLLLEKHIVVVGPSFSIVSTMIMSLLALVAPFDWMHILIPILPSSLINVLAAPPPYLIGILSSQLPLIQDIPIENAVMVHLNKYGKCEKVVYIRETEDDLPYSGTFSALGIGLRILKLRLSMEHTARDLCSLFLTYYATLFGNIITRGAKAYLNQEALSGKDLDFFRRLLSTQSFAVLNEEIGKSMRADNLDWLDNEFIVAMVRAHRTVFTEHYSILVREEEQGGGYIERYNECFGSSEDFTSWTAAVHGFGGHSVGVFRLVSHCLCSRWSSCFRDDDQEERMRSARFRQSCDAATQYHLSVNAQQENQQRRDGSTTSFAVIFGSPISSTPQTPAFSRSRHEATLRKLIESSIPLQSQRRNYGPSYSHTFSSQDEAKLAEVVLKTPAQIAVFIRESMQQSRRRIVHFRNCVTYVAIILQSHLQKKSISVSDAAIVVECLLKECSLLRQADMAHLLFRAALRFDKYGNVIQTSFLMLLFQSYRGNSNNKSIMRSIGDELKQQKLSNPKHQMLASIAYILSGENVTEQVSIEHSSERDIAVLIECFALAGAYEKMIDVLSELGRNTETRAWTPAERNYLFSTAMCSIKGGSVEIMESIAKLGRQYGVSFSDGAGATLLQSRCTSHTTFNEIAQEEVKVVKHLDIAKPMPIVLSVCVSRCAEFLLRQSSHGGAEKYLLNKVEDLVRVVNNDFLKNCSTDSDTTICVAVLRGYGSLKAMTKMRDFFDQVESCSIPNKHKLYEELLRWYSHAGMAKEAIAIKERMSTQHVYHTVHTYQYLFRALDTSYPQLVEKYYREMRFKSIRLDGFITPVLLRAFGEMREWAKVESLYSEAKADASRGSKNSFSARVVIQMLRCYRTNPERCKGVMKDARHFGLLSDETVQSECITIFSVNHQDKELEAFLSTISSKTPQIYRLLLRNASKRRVRKDFDRVLKLAEKSAEWDEKLVGTAITALSYFNDVDGVKRFVSMSQTNKWVVSSSFFAETASAFARLGVLDEVEKAWNSLLQSRFPITMPVYNRFLELYMNQNNIIKVQEVLDHMMESMPPNATTATTVIDMLGKMGRLEEMEAVLESMSSSLNAAPTLLTYHTAMNAYAKVGNIAKMEALRERIKTDGYVENGTTYNIRIEGYGRAKRFESVQEILHERKTANIEMDENAYIIVLSLFTRERLAGHIENLVDEMISNGTNFSNKLLAYIAAAFASIQKTAEMEKFVQMLLEHPDCSSRDVEMIYTMYAKMRDTVKIQALLDNPSLGRTRAIYNTCIAAFAKTGEHTKVAYLLSEMERENMTLTRPTKIVLSSLLVKAGQGELAQAILNSEDGEDSFGSSDISSDTDAPLIGSAEDETEDSSVNHANEESLVI